MILQEWMHDIWQQTLMCKFAFIQIALSSAALCKWHEILLYVTMCSISKLGPLAIV